MKKLIITRDITNDECTLSKCILLDENAKTLFNGVGLEPSGEPTNEINNNRPIKKGVYNASFYFSPRFQTVLPRLWSDELSWDKAVAIHTGNDKTHTKSCYLIAKTRTKNKVTQSKMAFNEFMSHFDLSEFIDKNNNTKLDENKKPLVAFLVEIV